MATINIKIESINYYHFFNKNLDSEIIISYNINTIKKPYKIKIFRKFLYKMLKSKILFMIISLFTFSDFAIAEGNLASRAERLPDMYIDSRKLQFSEYNFQLETGKYYRWRIIHDGGEEFQIIAPELFRNSWVNQVVINDIEVKPLGLHSIEFDDEGTLDVWFVPVRPGNFEFWVQGYKNKGLLGYFVVN